MSAPVQPRPFTSREEVNQKILTLRQTFQQGRTKDIRWRKWQLKQLYWMIEDNEAQIVQALNKDLGRHEFETMAADIAGVKGDIVEHIKHLEEWVADEHPNSGFLFSTLGSTVIRKEPLGLVLIIAAWNFPILLCFQPLVAAIASGCTAIVKPSEITQNAQDLVCQLMSKYLDPSYYTAVTGGVKETGYILSQKFDHIFFTGSTPVAKHVAKAAAIHLTPTVLELGGQGPAIVTKSADIDMAAKRISYAKFVNAGQICLSVNHVFVDPEVHTTFVQRLIYWHKKFSGGKDSGNQMANIVDDRNFKRLETMLQESLGEVVLGGSGNKHLLQFDATVIDNTTLSDSLLQTELFGPLLPVIVASSQDACHSISNMPHPLAIYIFSNAEAEIDYILDHTLSGGVSINDVFMHASAPDTPFGGVGDSGHGVYHGRFGIDVFCHKRVVVNLPSYLDRVMSFRYPPYVLKHKGKVAIRSSGFKRGEKLEDQKIRQVSSAASYTVKRLALLVFAAWLFGVRVECNPKRILALLGGLWQTLPRVIRR